MGWNLDTALNAIIAAATVVSGCGVLAAGYFKARAMWREHQARLEVWFSPPSDGEVITLRLQYRHPDPHMPLAAVVTLLPPCQARMTGDASSGIYSRPLTDVERRIRYGLTGQQVEVNFLPNHHLEGLPGSSVSLAPLECIDVGKTAVRVRVFESRSRRQMINTVRPPLIRS